jgi:hypothetical protein
MISTSDYRYIDTRKSLEVNSHDTNEPLEKLADETRNSMIEISRPWCCEPCKIVLYLKVLYYPPGTRNPSEITVFLSTIHSLACKNLVRKGLPISHWVTIPPW